MALERAGGSHLEVDVVDAVRLVVVARQHSGTNQRLPNPVLELARLMLAQLRVDFSPETQTSDVNKLA